jgi:DNA N-6-adenine-methyltransferase (Dam)
VRRLIPKAENGLTQEWHGVVWLNPPYSGIYRWVAKAVAYARDGGTVIALLPVWSDAPWFHDFMPLGTITLLRGKLSYVGRNGYAPFPSMIVEWNSKTVKRRASHWTSRWIPVYVSAVSIRRPRLGLTPQVRRDGSVSFGTSE